MDNYVHIFYEKYATLYSFSLTDTAMQNINHMQSTHHESTQCFSTQRCGAQ
jgi:hypothetical protein